MGTWRWTRRLAALAAMLVATEACAQIRTDASLGRAPQALAGPQYLIPESLGALRGSNLFHSFSVFNIAGGESATFTTSTSGIANVISRVTGGDPSAINGLLRLTAAAGKPNFFFINPAGVTFGAGASVDVPGAFHVSTADYVKFADGKFYADAAAASTLSSAPPEAFGFLGAHRGAVTVTGGAQLFASLLQPFSIAAGDITIDNARVATRGGDIRIVAIGDRAGEVPLSGALPDAGGNLRIVNGGSISAPSGTYDAGYVTVSAGDIFISQGASDKATGIFSQANTGSVGDAGVVDVRASGAIRIVDGGAISSSTFSSGDAGSVSVQARDITIDSSGKLETGAPTGIFSQANADSTGMAGNVNVAASRSLELASGGVISSSTFSVGDAGEVRVAAGDIVLDRASTPLTTGIFSNASAGTGNAGSVFVTTPGQLFIVNGASIASNTSDRGNAGHVVVRAADVVVYGGDFGFATITSSALSGSRGNAGSVDVGATGSIGVYDGGEITSSTFSAGDAGSVSVAAPAIVVDGRGYAGVTGIISQANRGTGDAGDVTVSASGTLAILGNGIISSGTFSAGQAGSVQVKAGGITIDGTGAADGAATGIVSGAYRGSTGNAGSVNVEATGTIAIHNAGEISSSTFTSGNAGSVKVSAGSIDIDAAGNFAGIYSQALEGSTGNAGTIDVNAAGLLALRDQAKITSTTFARGNAGTVRVTAGSLLIDGKGRDFSFTGISSNSDDTATGNAGSVNVTVSGAATIRAGGQIASSTFSPGDSGSVAVKAASLLVDGAGECPPCTGIYSQAEAGATGRAGQVDVTVSGDLVMRDLGIITTGTRNAHDAGRIHVEAGSILIDGGGYGDITGIASNAIAGAGSGGLVDIQSAGAIRLTDGGFIGSQTYASGNAGSVSVHAASLVLDGQGTVTPITSSAVSGSLGNAGTVSVDVSGLISLTDGGAIRSFTSSPAGNGGTVTVHGGDILIDRGSGTSTSINAQANRNTRGRGGNIDVRADRTLTILNGGFISGSTFGDGDAGTVTVKADAIVIDKGTDVDSGNLTGITSQTNGGRGNAGVVDVAARDIRVLGGGEISSSTFSQGNAAPVRVSADTILLDGKDTFASTGIYSRAESSSSGNAGSVQVTASGALTLLNGATVSTTTTSTGNAGAVDVHAGSLRIDGGEFLQQTGILSEASSFSAANAGTIRVSVKDDVAIAREGRISSDSFSEGAAGSVSVEARNISIDAADAYDGTGIVSRASYVASAAGTVDVKASGSVVLLNGAQISSSSDSYVGAAGSVGVTARDIVVDGSNAFGASSINARASFYSMGQTGNVAVTAANRILVSNGGELSITNDAVFSADPTLVHPTLLTVSAPRIELRDDGIITAASTYALPASNIAIHVGDVLLADNTAILTSAVDGNGGAITVDGAGSLILRNSRITTSVAGSFGNGGDITIATAGLVMETGFIQANTGAPDALGGNVNIDTSFLIPSGNSLFVGGDRPLEFHRGVFGYNVIQAAAPTGVSGAISITTPALDISAGLAPLNAQVLEVSGLGRGLCDGGSSLAQAGRGGLPPSARGLLRDEDTGEATAQILPLAALLPVTARITCSR